MFLIITALYTSGVKGAIKLMIIEVAARNRAVIDSISASEPDIVSQRDPIEKSSY